MMKPHPAAEIFPLMTGEAFDALVEDIREHGQLEAIVVINGEILDGRNRYRACQQLGIEPLITDHAGCSDPEGYVISKNLHRRHLNESQRAMVAARLANIPTGFNYQKREGGEISLAKAAEMLNVGRSTAVYAKKVLREGSPEEIAACDRGEASVNGIGRLIARTASPEKRKVVRSKALSQKGNNPERIQKQQMRAELWQNLKQALMALSNMPAAADVADMVRNMDKTGLVAKRLPVAQQFITKLNDVWTKETSNAA